ncbi:MAG: glycoside hydrolase family 127 protein, partial [Bacteroidales bacterium]|nr:glycoside hydrolase family 127 protein [Bacteroidales bacterium]
MKKMTFLTIGLLMAGALSAQSVYPGQHNGKIKKGSIVPLQAESFDLKDVRLLPSRFRDNLLRDSAWMVSLDANRLLHSFRTHAGIYAGREGGYMTVKKLGGWESLDCELRGHTTGHLLSAYGLMYAATGSEIFKLKGDSLVNGLAEVQATLSNGYLSAFPEELINRNLRGTGVWAPWYTLHKLFSGLIDQYLYADNTQALEIVTKMGDWAYAKLRPQSEETRCRMIRNEFGGINESFYNLYAITGKEEYRWLAEYFYHNDVIDPLKQGKEDLGTKHTNTFIPKVIAETRNYEINGSEESRKLSDFFWRTMIEHHTFAPGCSSDKEHYFDPKHLSEHLSGYTGETCCTYNMLKLSRHLFCWTADAR